ncbi:selenocysteine lyase-like isoform X4 [Dermacentor variabilis]|uniref:selenocysteine lyase-like isoform X4 n=1 Tax=Dermacentor variabilis TaxID=34621 RepID=UPI003F5B32DF
MEPNGGSRCVYLDYNATAPVEEEVQKSIIYALQVAWGNPTSNHDGGTEARRIIDEARISVASMIGASSPEIVFTSGGTESNNMIIHSLVRHFKKTRSSFASLSNCRIPHFITSNIEHNSIVLTLKDLYEDERIDLTIVPVSKATGSVSSEEIVSAIRPETCLITIMLANNETGIIQPVETIGTLLKDVNQQRKKDSLPEVLFHTDAAQALGKVPVNVDVLKVDYLTIAGHKFYGPRTGALYFRDSKPLYPLLFGAGQEGGLRPGADPSVSSTASLRSRWMTALLSSDLTAQLWAVQRAEEAASKRSRNRVRGGCPDPLKRRRTRILLI